MLRTVERSVPESLEHAREDLVGLRAGHEQPLVDEPSGDAAGADLDRGPRVRLDPLDVAAVLQGVDDLALVQSDGDPPPPPARVRRRCRGLWPSRRRTGDGGARRTRPARAPARRASAIGVSWAPCRATVSTAAPPAGTSLAAARRSPLRSGARAPQAGSPPGDIRDADQTVSIRFARRTGARATPPARGRHSRTVICSRSTRR
jgi:hypothetical protein